VDFLNQTSPIPFCNGLSKPNHECQHNFLNNPLHPILLALTDIDLTNTSINFVDLRFKKSNFQKVRFYTFHNSLLIP
jgi:hypothetical protein